MQFVQLENALELREPRVVVKHREVEEAFLARFLGGVTEREVVVDLQILSVPLERMSRINGKELRLLRLSGRGVGVENAESLVLTVRADGIAVGEKQEHRLVLAEALDLLSFRRYNTSVLNVHAVEVAVTRGELRFQHEFGTLVGIFSAHDREFLRGNPR